MSAAAAMLNGIAVHRPHPADALVDDVVSLYAGSVRRLEGIVQAGLRRGLTSANLGTLGQREGDATHAYRERQLAQANALLTQLQRQAGTVGPLIVARAYAAGVIATDKTVGPGKLAGEFGRVHVRAVEVAAANMTASLAAAAERTRSNVAMVFERAAALDGALPAGGRLAGVQFIGRRADDPYRRLALEAIGEGAATLDTRRQVSETLVRKLLTEGTTDAVTGFVDRAGRRWSLERYAAMVVRTTTREAMTTATGNRLLEHGLDLVTISSHAHKADECTPYDGQTFSLTGRTAGYSVLDDQPPFHPFCLHVMGPAEGDLDAFERELEAAALAPPAPVELRTPTPHPQLPPRATPADVAASTVDRPFPNAEPHTNATTLERLEEQRVADAITGDPGPEPGAREAWEAWAKSESRAANRALNTALGPDLAKFIDRKWGKDAGIRRQLLEGELTIDDATELAYEEYQRLESNRLQREISNELDYGLKRRSLPCFTCGQLKRRPSDICEHCGDDPVQISVGDVRASDSDRHKFDRAYGYGGSY